MEVFESDDEGLPSEGDLPIHHPISAQDCDSFESDDGYLPLSVDTPTNRCTGDVISLMGSASDQSAMMEALNEHLFSEWMEDMTQHPTLTQTHPNESDGYDPPVTIIDTLALTLDSLFKQCSAQKIDILYPCFSVDDGRV
jgi:hypothetical protein